MIVFLTSSPTGDLDGRYRCEGLDNRNGFSDKVKEVWKKDSQVLMITAFPDSPEDNKGMKAFFEDALRKTGLSVSCFDLWDSEILKKDYSRPMLQKYDVIILGGGHVPTQNAFFKKLNLRENIRGYGGLVIGISAGSMNCADTVYAQPEEPGEAIDPGYQRFIEGLGITDINVLPHYQMVKDSYKDGLHLFNEISIPDSKGREFIAIPDGSFIIDYNGKRPREIYGEAYIISDGKISSH